MNGHYPETRPLDSEWFRDVVEFLDILGAFAVILDLVMCFVLCFLELL